MIKCKDCKWWGDGAVVEVPNFKACSHPKANWNEQDGFASVNGDPYNGGIIGTGPEFGCIHGEATK